MSVISSDIVPTGSFFGKRVTQKHVDEIKRALGRFPWDFELEILEDVLAGQAKANRKLAAKGVSYRGHSMDEVVSLFIERIRKMETDRIAERITKAARV